MSKRKKRKDTKKYAFRQQKKLNNKLMYQWSLAVKARDDNKCVVCGDTKLLNAHHIIPREIKELRFKIENGISLCPLHHQFGLKISAHRNPFAFFAWLVINRPEQYAALVSMLSV